MKKLPFSFACTFLLFFFCTTSEAQDYKLAGGVRLGYPVSLSLKYFLDDASALEGYLGARRYGYLASTNYRSTVIGGAYLYHFPLDIDELAGLKWYVGGGAALYVWSYDAGIPDDDRINSSISIQGYLGLDYAFDDVPLNLTLDWVPTILLRGLGSGFGADYGSLGVRYIFTR